MAPEHADESGLSRRDFLGRTAYAAGLAGTMGLSAETILAEAAQASQRSSGLPSPRNVPIDHFVLLMMENRSFDHYFGWLHGFADATQRSATRTPRASSCATRPASTLGTGGVQFKGCGHPDPGHGWVSGRAQLQGGFLAPGSGNDEFALSYYNRGELGFIHEAARNYTLYDHYFCSLLGRHLAQPLLQVVGAVGRRQDQRDRSRRQQLGDDLRSRPGARPDGALLLLRPAVRRPLWRAVTPGSPRSPSTTRTRRRHAAEHRDRGPALQGRGGGDGLSADEHPLGDVRLGQAFQADVVNAFTDSKNYRRGALFVIYDEWGGFFDHVRPDACPTTVRAPT